MKTNQGVSRTRPILSLISLGVLLSMVQVQGKLSEPDTIVYGEIRINGRIINADRNEIQVEARRVRDGAVLAAYRMGAEPRLGNLYAVRIPMESLTPFIDPLTGQIGDSLNIVLSDLSGDLQTASMTIQERGQATRLNLIVGDPGMDNNGLPDDWEISIFGSNGQDPDDDPDGDGLTTREEYEGGTNPRDGNDVLELYISRQGQQSLVSFFTIKAEGPGYTGAVRLYILESTDDLGSGIWSPVDGFNGIEGNNEFLTYTTEAASSTRLYRLSILFFAP